MTKKIEERFTPVARRLLSISQELAEELRCQLIEPEFILLAMTHLENTDAYHILDDFDIIRSKLQPYLEKTIFPEFTDTFDSNLPHIDLAHTTIKVLELSVEFARGFGIHYISSVGLLIGLMRIESESMDKILAHFDVQRKDVIKLAKSYAEKHIYVENKKNEENIDDIGCIASILNMIGLNDDR